MKKVLIQKSALTLTELLISSMLIGITIIGLISVDTTIRRTQNVASLRANNIMQVSAALLQMQKDAAEARGFGIASISSGGSFPDVASNPVGFIFDASGTISTNPTHLGFCVRILPDAISENYFVEGASMVCYHSAGPDIGIIRRTYSLAWGAPTSTTNICDRCSFPILQEIPGGGLPLNYLDVKIERLANPTQPPSDLTNPNFWLQTSFSFNKVSR